MTETMVREAIDIARLQSAVDYRAYAARLAAKGVTPVSFEAWRKLYARFN